MHTYGWRWSDIDVMTRAVQHAPSVHRTRPWRLETPAFRAELYERPTVSLPYHDPTGRDRHISCGAALANLELSVRRLGWWPDVHTRADRGLPDLVATVRPAGPYIPTPDEQRRYAAIFHRRSHRRPFAKATVPDDVVDRIVTAARCRHIRVRVLSRDATAAAATLLGYAAAALRENAAYQRELSSTLAAADDAPARHDTLPWASLVRRSTRLPDTPTLADRLADELILFFSTDDDDLPDRLHAGAAAQRAWLTAVSHDIAGSVLTQPLQLSEVRARLQTELHLGGVPQLILRLGYPA